MLINLIFEFQPPKQKHMNYKELQEIRKKEKEEKQHRNSSKVCVPHLIIYMHVI